MRTVNLDLKAYIDAKLSDLAAQPDDVSPAQLLISAATVLIGITAKDSDLINMIRSTIAKPWGEAWCDDFVQTCTAYVETTYQIISPLPASEGVLDTWHRSLPSDRVQPPQPGDMILWQLGQTMSGHCGIITGIDSISYATVEGNTSSSIGIVRDGDGVFAKKRAKGGTKTFTEVGFLRVFP